MTLPSPASPSASPNLRSLLAGVRLACAFAILCYLVVQVGLHLRAVQETHWQIAPSTATTIAAPPGLLGVTVEMEDMQSDERRAALSRLADHNVSWVRQRIDWGTTEPEPGVFDWSWIDAWLADVQAANLTPVVILDGSPAWARAEQDVTPTDNPFAPPADYDTFARFAGEFANRYADAIRFYQVWDEPNITPHWGNRRIEPVHYAQLLASASAAIHAADATAVILAAALAPTTDRGHLAIDETYFLERMVAAGAASSFDAVAIQPFGFGRAATNPRQASTALNFQRAAFLRRALVRMGLANKPVWAVRFGWNARSDSPWGTVSASNQQAYVSDAAVIARQRWPWLAALGWAIDQPAAPPNNPVWGFALSDVLVAAFTAPNVEDSSQNAPTPFPMWLLGLTVLATAIVAWRMGEAAGILPWQEWRRRMLRFSTMSMLLLWGALLIIYYLATWPPLIVLCWVCGALLALCRPVLALWVALLAVPFTFQHKELRLMDGVVIISPMMAAALILLPVLGVRLAAQRTHWMRQIDPRGTHSTPNWLLLLLLAWLPINLLSALHVWNWAAYGRGLVELVIGPLVLAGAVIVLVHDGLPRRSIIAALFAGGALIAGIGLVRWLSGQGVQVDGVLRLTATQYSPNHTALYLLRTLFLGLGLALAATGRWRIGWLALLVGVASALLLTASRGALLLGAPFGVVLIVGLWLWQRRTLLATPSRLLLLTAPLLAMIIFLVVTAAGAQERLLNVESLESRALVWQAAWRLWREFPLIGVGPGGFFWTYPAHLLAGSAAEPNLLHPHNVWLEVATAWGVAGLIWFAILLATWFGLLLHRTLSGASRQRWLMVGLAAALLAGLAHAQVDAFLVLPDLAGWLFVALGLSVGWTGEEAQ